MQKPISGRRRDRSGAGAVRAGMPAVAAAVSILSFGAAAHAQQSCPTQNNGVPPGSNTTDPSAPFFIDLSGLDLTTSPPTRNPLNPEYPPATALPDGQVPPTTKGGNYIIGPTHTPAPETVAQAGVPKGTIYDLTLTSASSSVYRPGLVRDDPDNCLDASVYTAPIRPGDPSHVIITTSHSGTWTRTVSVYIPAQYKPGSVAPFIVTGDNGITPVVSTELFTVLDNLIHERKLPPIIAISVGPGGQDAQGSERGREYDSVSNDYTLFIETEVLPAVEQLTGVKLSANPRDRATFGISSSGAAAFTMAFYHPDLYGKVLAYSPTLVNQQWPQSPALPGGAWQFHSPYAGPKVPNENVTAMDAPTASDLPTGTPLFLAAPHEPIRFWFETGDRDLFYPDVTIADGMHDWTRANENMARLLKKKGYSYQFVFSENAGHVDGPTGPQTLPEALVWLWHGASSD